MEKQSIETSQPLLSTPTILAQTHLVGRSTRVIIAIFLIVVGGGLVLLKDVNLFNTQNKQSPDIIEQKKETQKQELIKYVPIPIFLKTVRNGSDRWDVFSIGTITSGQFKNRTLALAEIRSRRTDNNNYVYGEDYIGYFISDNVGNPVAWDKKFLTTDFVYESIKKLLNLTDSLQQNLDFLPREIMPYGVGNLATSDHKIIFSRDISTLYNLDIIQPHEYDVSRPVGFTEQGMQIFRTVSGDYGKQLGAQSIEGWISRAGGISRPSYYIALPFGKLIRVTPVPDILDAHYIPLLTWTTGNKSVASYDYSFYIPMPYTTYPEDELLDTDIEVLKEKSVLIQTGMTTKGDAVYEIDEQKYSLESWHQLLSVVRDLGTVPYDDFIKSHVIFFWKNSFGDWVVFKNRNFNGIMENTNLGEI